MPDNTTTSTALTQWTPMDVDELESMEKQIGFGAGSGNFFQFQSGKNVIRVMPGLRGKPAFLPFHKHFVKGKEGGRAWGCACALKMAKQTCVTCQVATKLSRGTEADRKLAEEIGARSRVLANLIDRAAPDAGVQVAEFGSSIYNAVKDIKRNLGDDPTHPIEGFDLVIEKTGQKLNTEYKVTPVRKNSPIHPDPRQMTDWLNEAPDLSTYCVVLPEHEQTAKLAETVISDLLRRDAAPAARTQRVKPSDTPTGDDDTSY